MLETLKRKFKKIRGAAFALGWLAFKLLFSITEDFLNIDLIHQTALYQGYKGCDLVKGKTATGDSVESLENCSQDKQEGVISPDCAQSHEAFV